jgi:hypothetical protein
MRPLARFGSSSHKCGYPIKKPEYRSVYVDPSRESSRRELARLQNEGWEIVDEHDEEVENSDGRFTLVVYKLMR